MQDARLERLFERFRRHGDVTALGQVFDETAGELLRVAMGLVREPGEADDLLQETFLTAIERAGRYESGRRLVPWLLGILVHHARERRRLARRGLDAARLERAEPERPEAALFGAELEREVERALAELSAAERRVLEAYLKHGKGAAEIATELGGSPGAVRMQIHRGLDRLRKALPVGLALGAAGGALSAQGLDGVRAAVLRAGETAAGTLATGAGSTLGGLGTKLGTAGVLVGKKAIVAVAVAAAFLALFFTWRGVEARKDSGRSGGSARSEMVERALQEAPLARSDTLDAPLNSGRSAGAGERAALGGDSLVGGLRGRLVERNGAPVAGKEVALLEIEEQALFAGFQAGAPAEAPRLLIASATSNADGIFVLNGARPQGALQALGIDLGGSRPSVRVLDVVFQPGEAVDLGDVVLAPTGVLRGRVVDERGAPLAGARVRVGELTDFLQEFGLYELAAGTGIGELRSRDSHEDEERLANDGLEVRYLFEIPEWLARIEERLPFAAVRTDERGEFVIGAAPAARVTLLLDRPGRTTVAATTVTVVEGDTRDAGTLTLDAGRTLAGRVLDASGKPVAGAEVRGGRAATGAGMRGPALFGPAVTADAEGRFRLTGISTLYESVLVARRDAASAWTALLAQGEAIELRLASESELIASVVDAGHEPIAEVAFEFLPGREAANVGAFAAGPRPVKAQSLGSGRWNLGARGSGSYQLRARAPGFAATTVSCELPATGPIELVLQRALTTEVRVVSAEDGAPLAGALVTAEQSERNGQVASATTDDEGRVRLELPDPGSKALWLRAEHARFAPRSQRLADPRAPVTLALGSGGSVVARADPRSFGARRHMLVLEYRGAEGRFELHFPLLAAFDAEGVARRTRLPAGQWSWSVLESLVAGEALGFLGEKEAPRTLARGEFELAEGEVLEFDIAPVAAAQVTGTGLVHGTVRVNGAAAEGVTMFLTPMTPGVALQQSEVEVEAGSFRFEEIAAGSYYLTAGMRSGSGFSQLGSQLFELAAGETREFTLVHATLELEVEVTNEAGERVAGALLMLWPVEGQGSLGGCNAQTDREGGARMTIAREGRYRFTASHPEFGMHSRELELAPGNAGRLDVRLERGVPCAGTARLAAGTPRPVDPVVLTVRREEGNVYFLQVQVAFAGDEAPFAFVGLTPGRYLVSALIADQWEPEVLLEVPQWGSTTLELVLGLPAPEPPR